MKLILGACDYTVVFGKNHLTVATDLNNLGMAWYSKGDYEKAISYFQHAKNILRDLQWYFLPTKGFI